MNLAALQQRDPYISEIVDTASQVALYSFNAKTNEWVRLFFGDFYALPTLRKHVFCSNFFVFHKICNVLGC